MKNYKEFGYNCLGPLLFGFTTWLKQNLLIEGINKLYFFSRDGYIMKQVFDMMYSDEQIITYYLEVSRRSLRVPILWKDYSFDNLMTMLGPSQLITLLSVFDAVGLDITAYNHLLNKYGFDENSFFFRDNIRRNKNLMLMYQELSEDIKANSLKEYTFLKEYIHQVKLEGKFAIVDIGWSGGMQRFLQVVLKEMGIDAEIYGYYTGVADYYTRNIQDGMPLNLNGYLFDFYHNPKDNDLRSCFVGLYEMLFLETKGSVKRYVHSNDGSVKAERYDYEYCINGKMLLEVDCIKEVQTGALSYVYDKTHSCAVGFDSGNLIGPLIRAGQKPTQQAIDLFADFRFFDEGQYSFLAKPKPLLYYLFHIDQFKADFFKSRWKTAFLKRLFCLPISYYGIYNYLKSIKN